MYNPPVLEVNQLDLPIKEQRLQSFIFSIVMKKKCELIKDRSSNSTIRLEILRSLGRLRPSLRAHNYAILLDQVCVWM